MVWVVMPIVVLCVLALGIWKVPRVREGILTIFGLLSQPLDKAAASSEVVGTTTTQHAEAPTSSPGDVEQQAMTRKVSTDVRAGEAQLLPITPGGPAPMVLVTVDMSQESSLGIELNDLNWIGVVHPGSAAERAGLQVGDVVRSWAPWRGPDLGPLKAELLGGRKLAEVLHAAPRHQFLVARTGWSHPDVKPMLAAASSAANARAAEAAARRVDPVLRALRRHRGGARARLGRPTLHLGGLLSWSHRKHPCVRPRLCRCVHRLVDPPDRAVDPPSDRPVASCVLPCARRRASPRRAARSRREVRLREMKS